MSNWNSSPHPISDIRDWSEANKLELRPDFQRKAVWNDSARIMLMDTILNDIPMPKVFLSAVIKDNSTYRIVIDGQQRLSAILSFLKDEFELSEPYNGPYKGMRYSELPEKVRDNFLQYKIDFNEIKESSDDELREIYSRVNKYTFALNKQELRKADYPGDFLDLSEKLANDDYLDSIRLFTPANRRRLGDVEYVSELLAALMEGPQNKKESLDDFYKKYAVWDSEKKEIVEDRFKKILDDLKLIFDGNSLNLSKTRFRQKADFYSLFLSIDGFHQSEKFIVDKELDHLKEDLNMLDYWIEPNSSIKDLSEYAIKCVSDANSQTSREWRVAFLSDILRGTYISVPPKGEAAERYVRILNDLCDPDPFCPPCEIECAECGGLIDNNDPHQMLLAWGVNEKVFQLSNSCWLHKNCYEKEKNWKIATEIDPGQLEIFSDKDDGED